MPSRREYFARISIRRYSTAQGAGIALNTYSRIERGQTSPARPTVRALASALDVSMAELGAALDAQG